MSRIDATPWVRDVLNRVDWDAIESVLPPGAAVRLSCRPKPTVYRRETYTAVVGLGDRSARATGRTPLSATIQAVHELEAAL
jgi:hypothetical protein